MSFKEWPCGFTLPYNVAAEMRLSRDPRAHRGGPPRASSNPSLMPSGAPGRLNSPCPAGGVCCGQQAQGAKSLPPLIMGQLCESTDETVGRVLSVKNRHVQPRVNEASQGVKEQYRRKILQGLQISSCLAVRSLSKFLHTLPSPPSACTDD